jgi:hypothetical protein
MAFKKRQFGNTSDYQLVFVGDKCNNSSATGYAHQSLTRAQNFI